MWLVITIIFSALLILPILVMFLDCWKKTVYPCFEISSNFYSSLNRLAHKNIESFTLFVNDNSFGREKASVLNEVVSKLPKLIGFTFVNMAEPIDYEDK